MLYVNDEPLDIRNKDDERVQFYLNELAIIRQKKDYVVIQRIKTESKLMKDDKGRLLREPFTTIPCKWVVNSVRGTEEWRWAETRRTRNTKGGNVFAYDPNHFILNDEMHLNPEGDGEKIFYLTRIAKVESCGCRVFDPVAEAQNRNAMSGGDELDARYMLFRNPDVTEEKIRTVALAWGIDNADTVHIDILKDRLWEAVKIGEVRVNDGARGFRNFVKDFQNDDKTEMRATIQKSIQQGIIEYNALQKGWFYKNSGELIARVPDERIQRKFEILVEYFSSHSDLYENLHIDMMGAPIPPAYSIKDIDGLPDMVAVRMAAKQMKVQLPINIKIENAKKRLVDSLS